jgi:cytochrome b pre-mRNA-processing protein 3
MWFGKSKDQAAIETAADGLYGAIVRQARAEAFFSDYQVPDTPDGRFDLIALHAALVLRRLRDEAPRTARLSQALFDRMFIDMDESLREMGVGDLSVGRYVKGLARNFYGRLKAYGDALDAGDAAMMQAALARNLYRQAEPTAAVLAAAAAYLQATAAHLQAWPVDDLMDGRLVFAAPAAVSGAAAC